MYLFIFAIWLRRDVERKREKSRCAQLLAAALARRDLVPERAALPSSRPRSPGPEPRPSSTWGRDGDTPGHLLHPRRGSAVSVDVASRARIPPQR